MKKNSGFGGILVGNVARLTAGRATMLVLALGAMLAASTQAQTSGTYTGGTGNYSNTANWSGGTVATGSGSTMTVTTTANTIITFDQSATIGNLTVTRGNSGQTVTLTGSSTTLTFADPSGTPVWNFASSYSTFDYVTNLNIAGTAGLSLLGKSNALVLQTGTTWTGFSGTVTLNISGSPTESAELYAQGNNVLSGTDFSMVAGTNTGYGNARLVINGGTTQTVGALTNIVSGSQTAYISAYGGSDNFFGSSPTGNSSTNTLGSTTAATLDVGNGGDSGTFSGTIGGMTTAQSTDTLETNATNAATATANAGLNIVKIGAGTQVFSGSLLYSGTTTVNAGTLLITGTHTGAGAYTVNSGGTLGGAGGSITTSNANVTIASGGKLNISNQGGATGYVLTPGTLTLSLGTGSLDISAVAADHSNELTFSLGTTSDKVLLSSGGLTIGTGLLNLSDFTFVKGTGFTTGSYVLIDDSAGSGISGSLASTGLTSTALFSGDLATLSESGNDIILNVAAVPEPETWAMLIGGLGMLAWVGRRRVLAV